MKNEINMLCELAEVVVLSKEPVSFEWAISAQVSKTLYQGLFTIDVTEEMSKNLERHSLAFVSNWNDFIIIYKMKDREMERYSHDDDYPYDYVYIRMMDVIDIDPQIYAEMCEIYEVHKELEDEEFNFDLQTTLNDFASRMSKANKNDMLAAHIENVSRKARKQIDPYKHIENYGAF